MKILEDLTKFSLKQIPQHLSVFSDDYLGSILNIDYEYYTMFTIHIPNKNVKETDRLPYKFTQIYVHRGFTIGQDFDKSESRRVFEGMVGNQTDLENILKQLWII